MPLNRIKKFGQIGAIILLPLLALAGMALVMGAPAAPSVRAAEIEAGSTELEAGRIPPQQEPCNCNSGDILNCANFDTQQAAQACLDHCQATVGRDVHRLDGSNNNGLACEHLASEPDTTETGQSEPTPVPTLVVPEPTVAPSDNLIFNGNFEFGFYPVAELGFEAGDIGNVPNNWNWFKSEAHGKYTINNNEGFGLVCRDDLSTQTRGKNSLSLHMQSTDQPDARLGVYQTVNVVPGRDYLFSISGTIQVQPGGSSPDKNHRLELFFDQTGGTDWRAIPNEKWTSLPWPEADLEFDISGPEDPDLAKIQDYYAIVTAQSNKMTIFIRGWRRWPNWRTAIFTLDCVSLIPLSNVDVGAIIPKLSQQSTTDVDRALEAAVAVQPGSSPAAAEPAAAPAPGSNETPATEPAIIPPSGGILDDDGNWLLIAITSIVVIVGLVGAGIWNIQRQKR